MSDLSDLVSFDWQKDESVAEKIAVCDLAAFLYGPEYRKLGSERHRAKARVRSAMARASMKGELAAPISFSPKILDVKNLLLFACARWPDLRDVITVIDTAAKGSAPAGMEIGVGSVEVEIDLVPSTYRELLSQYRSLRASYHQEKTMRKDVELELEKLRQKRLKRRSDGAKRYE